MEMISQSYYIIPIKGFVPFPGAMMHLEVHHGPSVKAIEKTMEQERSAFFVTQRPPVQTPEKQEDLYPIGVVALVKQVIKLPGNRVRVVAEGLSRGELMTLKDSKGDGFKGDVHLIETDADIEGDLTLQALVLLGQEAIESFGQVFPKFSKERLNSLKENQHPERMADAIASNCLRAFDNQYKLLAELDVEKRLRIAIQLLETEIEVGKVRNHIQDQVKINLEKHQKEYYLREQIKVIQKELGDDFSQESEIENYQTRVKELNAEPVVKERLDKEINRLKRIPPGSAEGSVIRHYIEWLLDMPWHKKDATIKDLNYAKKVLNDDHYGLEQVKKRVLEHLAVRQLSDHGNSPILCLVGPPGTGKTSVAQSIAKALGRGYSRIALGGVRDEAEIRGHRKTYIGAMPGRITNALKYAGTSNPLILLDEIDKMTSDMRGNPSAALLEVLDGEQNKHFRDHYMEVPMDLSDVLFVATANSLRHVEKPLLDRLEIIELSSYTDLEKYHIANKFLLPKQKALHGLKPKALTITKQGMMHMIHDYTKESGVRQIERVIGELCRKAAMTIVSDQETALRVTGHNLKDHLGVPKYRYEMANKTAEIGIARGLAWTVVGGDTLSIEVNVMEGTGQFDLTGQMGDVMKESAKAAISYIRSQTTIPIDHDFYRHKDIHIHIPEGAVPKDGPSAGITMATAMISALTDQAVRHDVAMTGEITIRGRVLGIGGLKEKLIAAKRARIQTVIVPKANMKDVVSMSSDILEGLDILYVDHMDEVIKITLLKGALK